MRSKVLQRILDKTPKEVEIFVDKYADLILRINQILREKGYTQKSLAENLEQTPAFLQGTGIRWVAVTDALPKIASENYLVVKNGIVSISLFRGDWNEFQCDLNDFQKVTHWSECPKPPCL